MFPVEIEYLEKPANPDQYPVWNLATDELDRLASRTEGDVLIFMPGAYEISRTVSAVQSLRHDFMVLPLHGELPPDQQDAAVARYNRRKVVVSTNVAETSLTIDGVRLVIDCGLAKIARFDPHRGINTLLTERISRASADQRAGRAGRTAPGRCLRLWTEREHRERAAQELPEVKRLDLAEVVLTLKASGVRDVSAFRWLEAPDPKALERAETLLMDLGAVSFSEKTTSTGHSERLEGCRASVSDAGGAGRTHPSAVSQKRPTDITPIGRRLLAFPVHPRYARMLLAAHELGCVRQAALVAALTQGRAVLQRSAGKQMDELRSDLLGEQAESDFFILMRAFKFAENKNFNTQPCRQLGIHAGAAREAAALFDQFLRIAKDEGLDIDARPASDEAIQKCVLAGFSDQLAARLDRGTLRCALVHGRRGVLARESAVHHSTLLVASEIREQQVKGDLTTLLSLATAVNEDWLRELFPGDFAETDEALFDPAQKRVVSRRARRFRDLILSTETSDKFLPEQAAEILADKVLAGDAELAQWTPAVEQWIVRVSRLREWMPELELPAIDADARRAIVAEICHGASSLREIRERPVFNSVKSWLSRAQQEMVEKFAPERITLPSGRDWKIAYDEKAAPSIAARIQQLYGLEGKLTICAGRVPLLIQVLAPNMRPVQVTQDLTTFWREMYPKLKVELQRKYPKHEWR
jgi:ATP-dependent helicase HrpB